MKIQIIPFSIWTRTFWPFISHFLTSQSHKVICNTFYCDGNNMIDPPTIILPIFHNTCLFRKGTKIFKNIWGICINIQLGPHQDLNYLSNEFLCVRNKVIKEKVSNWGSIQPNFHIFALKYITIFVVVVRTYIWACIQNRIDFEKDMIVS